MPKRYPSKGLLFSWKRGLLLIPLAFLLFFSTQTYGQGYVHTSRLFNGTGIDLPIALIVDDAGNSYYAASVTTNSFPVTIPGVATGTTSKTVLIKFAPDGSILWSRYMLTSTGQVINISKLTYENGKLYCMGFTAATGLPTTDGSTYRGGTADILFYSLDANTGAIETMAYLGGSGTDNNGEDIVAENGYIYLTYATNSPNIPVTTGPAFTTQYDHIIQKLRPDGSIVYSTYTGQATTLGAFAAATDLEVENGIAALGIVANSINFPTTNGSTVRGGADYGLIKLNADGSTQYRLLYGGTANEESTLSIILKYGEVYLSGTSLSTNYPVTDGTSFTGAQKFHVLTKFNSTGALVYSTLLAGITTGSDIAPIRFNSGSLFFFGSGYTSAPAVDVTDGSTGGNYVIRLNPATGKPVYATRYGGNRSVVDRPGIAMQVVNGQVIAMASAFNVANHPVTDGSTRQAQGGNHLVVFSPEGKLTFGTYKVSGSASTELTLLAASPNKIFVAGSYPATSANHIAVTEPIIGGFDNNELQYMGFTLCPPMPTQNDITPLLQNICAGGFTQQLTGNKVTFGSENMPILNRTTGNVSQQEIVARYQWQGAASPSGPWTNIPGTGTLQDYSPPSLAETRYYRRLVLPAAGCGETPVSTSAVAEVVVGSNASPTITSIVYNTCPGTPVDIEATVTGGATPYIFAWDNGIASTTNTANVSPTAHSVYTVTVTDNNGCEQKGQVIVNAYAANAGPDLSVCGGKPVRLGAAPPAGLAGVVYAWTPATDLDDPNIAQPLATPVANQVYTLSMTIPVTGGGTCNTTDDVNVNVVAGPTTANFAGPDVAVCKGGTIGLGTTAEPGFTYTWSPGNYLNAVNTSTVTFTPGADATIPNPITYTLTATSGACSFTDEVTVAVLSVDAGEDLCGPRTVGKPDPLPGVIGKTFLWEVVSGTGTITGATNTATTTVSASTGGSTTYRLTISYLGTSCTDEVVVTDCASASCPLDDIQVLSDNSCPSTAFGAVTLRANPATLPAGSWTYSWSAVPAGGLSATTGSSVTLTDNTERDITVTITSINNPAYSCSKSIHVNGAGWALPVFTAQDHIICTGTTVNIGQALVAGYSYSWTEVAIGDQLSSNPAVSPTINTKYVVTVTEDLSGCTIIDTATVKVSAVLADPGADWNTCSNAVVQLGAPAKPSYTYSWTPAVASYQDGTDNTSAQPKVLIATTQDFTLRATDTETGCFHDSIVHIVIDNSAALPTMRDTAICLGGSAIIGNPGVSNVTYSWSPATGLSSTTVAQPIASPASTQTYTLIVTYYDVANAPVCTKSGTVTVTVNGPTITMSDDLICPSASLYDLSTGVTLGGTAATAYAWYPANLVTNPTTFGATVIANPTTAQQYTLIVSDANGCRDTATRTISPTNAAPIAGSNSLICVGSNVKLGSASNTGTISWSADQALAGSLSDANAPEPVFTPAAGDAGKNIVFTCSQDIAGCVNTASVTIRVRTLTLPSIPVQTVCTNASTTIGVTPVANVNYSWSPATGLSDAVAASTTVNSVAANITYTLTAIDINGCVATSEAVIGVHPTPAPAVSVADVHTQVGTPAAAFDPQINPAVGTYIYNWTPANKVNDPYLRNAVPTENKLGTTAYQFSATDGNGCTSSTQAFLHVQSLSVLPITLSSFTASTTRNCGVNLEWKVSSASNFSHFVVERSLNGGNFVAVQQAHYQYNRENYFYQDGDPGNGKWSYRLKLVDIDGRSTYSKIVFTEVKCTAKNSLKIYPNPASSVLYINSSKPVQRVTVYSLAGNLILRKDFAQFTAGVVQLPVSNLITGVYLVQVTAKDGTSQVARLVKD